jgi:hypothetical protein
LGLAVGLSAGVDQAGLGRANLLVTQAAADPACRSVAEPLAEARVALGGSMTLTTVAMYLGVAIAVLAGIGLSRDDSGGHSTAG